MALERQTLQASTSRGFYLGEMKLTENIILIGILKQGLRIAPPEGLHRPILIESCDEANDALRSPC